LIYGFIEDDTIALLKTFYENYNLFLIAFGIAAALSLVFIISKIILKLKRTEPLPNILMRILISILLPCILFIMIRGTFGWNSIGQYADISSNLFINKTAINCLFTLQRAIEHKEYEKQDIDYIAQTGYKDNIRQAFADFLDIDINDIPKTNPENSLISTTAENKLAENMKPNIILIAMESFGSDLIQYNSNDFNVLGSLKEHFDNDIVFYNFTSEGSVTIQAIEATFTNIVIRYDSSIYISQSKYMYNHYPFSSIKPYKQNDYEAVLLYGDNTSWRNMGEFALNIGFDQAISAAEVKKDSPRGPWGIYDEYLFDLAFETLSNGENSRFIYILTTTNHPPYSLPKNYKALPLNMPASLEEKVLSMSEAQKRFAAYQYANEMLGRFISKIKNSKYAKNTIIAVTGDHSYNSYNISSFFDSIKVPFYLYIPQEIKPKNINSSVFGSHLDIMTTLYNLSLSKTQYMSQGTDLLSKKASNNAAFYKNRIISKDYIVKDDLFADNKEFYIRQKDGLFKESERTPAHSKLLKKFLSAMAISDYLIKNTGETKKLK
jgi:phosphoglycerol transferase MdoB-like AlkP superfamily enzyme